MALFLSTHTNKLDKKGRVSVPAQWRAELAAESYQGIVVFPSSQYQCIEGFAWSAMQEINARMNHFDLFSTEQDDFATAIFAQSIQLPFDGDGRVVLPDAIIEFGHLNDQVSFVGMGGKFQIWSPELLVERKKQARKNVKDKKMTLPKAGEA